ncbi:hypothetical protein [Bradyrhizobium retamae]|uniref:hypothetical protein n=1 Tax=Bradyrhizobium retamae TaxID=1300035 RepID=UPI000A3F72D7|nr:hypothetical protein [Bradyrhizobium retamae]
MLDSLIMRLAKPATFPALLIRLVAEVLIGLLTRYATFFGSGRSLLGLTNPYPSGSDPSRFRDAGPALATIETRARSVVKESRQIPTSRIACMDSFGAVRKLAREKHAALKARAAGASGASALFAQARGATNAKGSGGTS